MTSFEQRVLMTKKKTEIRTIVKKMEEAENPAVKRLWDKLLQKYFAEGTPGIRQYINNLTNNDPFARPNGRNTHKLTPR